MNEENKEMQNFVRYKYFGSRCVNCGYHHTTTEVPSNCPKCNVTWGMIKS